MSNPVFVVLTALAKKLTAVTLYCKRKGANVGTEPSKLPVPTTLFFIFTRYPSTVRAKLRTGFQLKPKLLLKDDSCFSLGIPAALVIGLLLGFSLEYLSVGPDTGSL